MGCRERREIFPLANYSNQQKQVIVRGELPIESILTATSNKDDYLIRLNQHIPLASTFQIDSIVTNPTNEKIGIIAHRGAIIESVTLSWTFTKNGSPVDVNQVINNNGADNQIVPTSTKQTTFNTLSIEYLDTITEKRFTLTGNDGSGNVNGVISKSVDTKFGAKVFAFESTFEDNDTALKALIEAANFSIKENINQFQFNPISLDPAIHVYIAYPSDWGVIAFIDKDSPILIDPMKIHRESFAINNGIIEDSYNILISEQGALAGAIIVPA